MAIWKVLDISVDILLAVALTGVSLIITANVILRFVFHTSLLWSGEISGGLLVWITFLGAFQCSREKSHLAIDLFTEHCSVIYRIRLAILRSIIQWISFASLAYLSFRVTQLVGGGRMQTIDWPVGIWLGGVFVGFVLLTLSESYDLAKFIARKGTCQYRD